MRGKNKIKPIFETEKVNNLCFLRLKQRKLPYHNEFKSIHVNIFVCITTVKIYRANNW